MKMIWKFLLGISLVIILAVGSLPVLLSTYWGKQYLLKTLNAHLPGTITASHVRFSWIGPQKLNGLNFKDSSGTKILTVATVQADIPLYQLIFNKIPYGSIRIEQLNLQFKDVGITNAQGLIELPQRMEDPVKLMVHGQTYQLIDSSKQLGNFDIDLILNNLVDLTYPQSFSIKVEKFPVALFNHIVALYHPSLGTIPTQILGNMINLSLEQNSYPNNGQEEHLFLKVSGDKLNATLGLQLKENILSIDRPTSFSFTLPPELSAPLNVEVALDEMQLPLAFFFPSEESMPSLADSAFLFHLHLTPTTTYDGPYRLKHIDGRVEASKASSIATVHLNGEILTKEQPLIIDLKAAIDKPLCLHDLWEKMRKQVKVKAKLENEKAILQGILHGLLSDSQILITEPIELTLIPKSSDSSKLPGLTKLTIQPPKQPIQLSELSSNCFKELELNGELAIHHWIHQKVEIETLHIPWVLDGPSNQINSRLYGSTRVARQDTAELHGECTLSNWLDSKGKLQLDQLKFKAKAHGKALPIAALETLCGSTAHFSDLLGDTIDYTVEMKGALSPQVSGFLNLSVNNPQLQSSLALEISDSFHLLQERPIELKLTLTPERINSWLQARNLPAKALTKPAQLVATIYSLKIPNAKNIDIRNLSIEAKAKTTHFPTTFLCQLAGLSEETCLKTETLLGNTIDSNAQIKTERMSGPIHFQLKGEHGNLSLDGQINQKGLLLNRPFQMEIAVSPTLGYSVLADLVPILTGVLRSEQPLRLRIEPQGFFLPLAPFDLASLRIEKASLELGHLTFRNEGQLDIAYSLLRPEQHESISVWCTPLYFSILGGKANLQRMDMLLLNRYPMALWGNIHLVKDRVDLRIGLTGTALSNALNIKGLEPDYILQVPLAGTLRKASIDKTKATAKLSSLVAQSQGGPQGLVLGAVLGIVGGDFTEERAPAPTTQPLPWASTLLKEEATPKKIRRNLLEEAASTLIDSVLH